MRFLKRVFGLSAGAVSGGMRGVWGRLGAEEHSGRGSKAQRASSTLSSHLFERRARRARSELCDAPLAASTQAVEAFSARPLHHEPALSRCCDARQRHGNLTTESGKRPQGSGWSPARP